MTTHGPPQSRDQPRCIPRYLLVLPSASGRGNYRRNLWKLHSSLIVALQNNFIFIKSRFESCDIMYAGRGLRQVLPWPGQIGNCPKICISIYNFLPKQLDFSHIFCFQSFNATWKMGLWWFLQIPTEIWYFKRRNEK